MWALRQRLSFGDWPDSATPALPLKKNHFVSGLESSLDQCSISENNKVIESKHHIRCQQYFIRGPLGALDRWGKRDWQAISNVLRFRLTESSAADVTSIGPPLRRNMTAMREASTILRILRADAPKSVRLRAKAAAVEQQPFLRARILRLVNLYGNARIKDLVPILWGGAFHRVTCSS